MRHILLTHIHSSNLASIEDVRDELCYDPSSDILHAELLPESTPRGEVDGALYELLELAQRSLQPTPDRSVQRGIVLAQGRSLGA